MPTRICPDVLNDCNPCAGEFPYENLSAELAEPYVFVSPHIIIRNPPLGKTYTQLGCKRWCYSTISQADADACAAAQATECATIPGPDAPIIPDPPGPPIGYPTVSVFASEPTTSFGQDPGKFLLSRNGSLAQPLAVQFTLSGTAENGVDYETVPYAVTINAGDSDVEVIIIPTDSGDIVSKEVILTVLSGSNYAAGANPRAIVDIVIYYEVAWNDPPRALDPPLDNTDDKCPWPNAYYTQKNCLCEPFDQDPYRWPLGGEGIPNDSNSSVSQINDRAYIVMESYERVYLRQAINGGASGKHVKMTVNFSLPGGIHQNTSFNETTGETDVEDAFNSLELAMNENPCAVFAFDAHRQVYVNESPSGAAQGVAVYEFDIAPGVDAYACLQANASTNMFGPCTVELHTEITSL